MGSCPELDLMAEIARNVDGCVGSRMSGAGFGGCTVNLVEGRAVDEFKEEVGREYSLKIGIKPSIYVSEACEGAGLYNQMTKSP